MVSTDKSTSGSAALLMREYRDLGKEKWLNIEMKDDSVYNWIVAIMVVNSDSYYDGGYFKAEMKFTNSYPYSPPEFKFLRPIFHPNIYADGKLCISILHPPGDDEMSGETASERWSPLQGVESVLRSVLLLLDSPEITSAANVDASVMYRDNREAFIARAKADVKKSKDDIPAGFTLPTTLIEAPPVKFDDDENFWNESEAEDDFGGSDSSDDEMQEFEEDGEDQEFESDDDAKETTKT
jgi:ubiquitin-conjugating enzyme E2 R